MLFGLVPMVASLGLMLHQRRQNASFMEAAEAIHLMAMRGVDRFPGAGVQEITFIRRNVTDADLDAFAAAFRGRAPYRFEVRKMRLNGSPVSPAAIARFRQAVPHCELLP
jgi:hypothetical protein